MDTSVWKGLDYTHKPLPETQSAFFFFMVIYTLNQENAPHLCKCHVCHPTGRCRDCMKGQLLPVQQKIFHIRKGSLACTELKGRFSLSKESLRRTFIMVLTVLHFIPY